MNIKYNNNIMYAVIRYLTDLRPTGLVNVDT